MALPTNTTTTYDTIGQREDLSDIIYDISPMDTPVVSNMARTTATARIHEWQVDQLAAAAANTALEGDDPTPVAVVATTRPTNFTQILEKTVVVSETARAVITAGRSDELDYQALKVGNELKRDLEFAVTQNQESTLASEATGRSLGSIESWLKSTGSDANAPYTTKQTSTGAATSPGFTSAHVAAPVDGATADAGATFAETDIQAVIRQAWINGGNPEMVVLGPFNKQKASAFAGIATQQRDNPRIEQAKIIGAADLYVSDFGEHAFMPDRFSRDRTALVLDMNFWAIAELRPFSSTPLAKTGDNEKIMVLTEVTLEARNALSSGKVADMPVA